MKNKIFTMGFVVIFSGLFVSCATTSRFSPGSGNKYRYTYKLISPAINSQLMFRDDSIIIQFKFDDAAIQFQLQNISESNLTIDWSKASLGISGRYYPVRHATNFYGDTNRSSSVMMPPLGYLREVVIPRDNIYDDGEKWVELDLVPTTDRRSPQIQKTILKNAGQRVNLILPMTFGSVARNYKFDFQIDSVKRIAWKDFAPVKRTPAPPHPNHATALDHVTTAVIMVGVLGFSAYALSLKKNPPVE
ncbi:MAG: hypothetical protein EHM64_13145 [Ignavibacteriae bacterium]|nr:MAG: hypothetical protein EHM64_13145 [Ignavibacteriota bacterium]